MDTSAGPPIDLCEIASVTVAFNPAPDRLVQQLRSLIAQVGHVLVVDNHSDAPVRHLVARAGLAERVHVVENDENLGIGAALNRGLAAAERLGAQWVLLLDHDSVPGPYFVAPLLDQLRRSSKTGGPIAAIGPRIVDRRDSREYPFVQLGWLRDRRIRSQDAMNIIECDFLMTSGSLVPINALKAIGKFEERLFVDSVDMEWSYRARSLGYRLLGCCAVTLDHELGAQRARILSLWTLVVHPPARLYFMTRNRLLLYRLAHVPFKWKMKDVFRMASKCLASCLFLTPRGEYARMCWRGFRDGMLGRGGPLVF